MKAISLPSPILPVGARRPRRFSLQSCRRVEPGCGAGALPRSNAPAHGFLCALSILTLVLAAATALAGSAPVAISLGSLPQSFTAPARVAASASGRVFVADPVAGRVTVLDSLNRVVSVKDGLAGPLGVAAGIEGRVYVGEANPGSVTLFNAEWQALSQLGAGAGEFLLPGHIAVDMAAVPPTVYVSDSAAHEVKAYREGVLLWRTGGLGSGNGQFNFPAGLWVGPTGELFVADQENDRIQVLNSSGAFVRAFTLRPPGVRTRSGRAQGLTGDALGRLYVADTFQGFVKVYEGSGAFLGYVGGYGDGPGQLLSPGGVALDSGGRLLVASANTARVEAFGVDCFLQLAASPAQQGAPVGSTVTFTATLGCAGPFTFQWRKGADNLVDGGRVSGATNATLTLTGVAVEDTGVYSVVATGPGGALTSAPAALAVLAAPTITASPTTRTAAQGGNTAFSVGALGLDLRYQWFFNGAEVPGATANTLLFTNLQPYAAGSYLAVVSNPAGRATSAVAQLTIVLLPSFLEQPVDQTVAERGSVTFRVLAMGTEPLRYQWYRSGTILSGQTAATLVLTNITPPNAGIYTAVASTAAGSRSSTGAVLTVLPDTIAPVARSAAGGRATNRTVLLSFSEPMRPASAQVPANYQVFGPSNRIVISAVVTNATNVLLTLSGPREAGADYAVRIRNVTDTAYAPNLISPNPTTLPILGTVDLMGMNSFRWKYWQTTNASGLDGTAWKLPAYVDTAWSNGFGIFWGHRSNSVYQPNPNPNVTLPVILNTSAPDTTRAYTILNVFTNANNVLKEITYYFRGSFNFPGETNGAALLLRSMVDDGAVFYLNGVEALRLRMAAAPTAITASTLANAGGSQAWEPGLDADATVLPLTGLRKGTNVLAVEVHQNSTTSTDITFGAVLEAAIRNFSIAAPTLNVTRSGSYVVLTWSNPFYVLEGATDATGPWSYVTDTSPLTVTPAARETAPVKFYRLRRQ